jgi:hypothetical protein
MRRLTATVASLVILLGAANYAAAKGGVPPVQPAGGCAKAINLKASPAGVAITATGKARVRAFPQVGFLNQDFVVEMAAVVPDGTTFMVFANGQPAGTITIAVGHGALRVTNVPPSVLPAGSDPVCSILSVIVADGAGNLILSGSF